MLGRNTILYKRENKVHNRTDRLEQQRAAHETSFKRRRGIVTNKEVEKIIGECNENTRH